MVEAAAHSVKPGGPPVASAGQDPLGRLWSVRLPGWLDPWAPQLADAFADGAWTARWGVLPALAPLVAGALGLFFAVFWPWIDYVYSESLVFMALVIAAAILSGPLGVMMLFGYILGDFLGDVFQGYYIRAPLGVAGGRLIGYLLLAILAVRVPQLARRMAERVPLPANPGVRFALRAVFYAAACALLVYLWCQAMIVLIRPVFTWVGSAPTVPAIHQVQVRWGWLVAVAVVAAAARMVLEEIVIGSSSQASNVADLQQQRWSAAQRRGQFRQRLPALVRVGLDAVMITLLMAGMYVGWIDAVFVALAVAALGAWRYGLIGKVPAGWAALVRKVPALVRYAVAPLVGYLLAYAVLTLFWRLGTFRPVTLGALLTLAMFYLLFPRPPLAVSPQRRQAK